MSTHSITFQLSPDDLSKLMEIMQMLNIQQITENTGNTENNTEKMDSDMVTEPGSPTSELDEEYIVRDVIDARQDSDGTWSFLVTWVGYTDEQTWVHENDCNCEELIAKYLASAGIKTVYLVCRVSSVNQTQEGCISLQAQEENMRHALKTIFNHITGIYRVKVLSFYGSAYKKMPQVLEHLGDYVNPGDMIMAWRIDRIGRNLANAIVWLNKVHAKGVTVYAQQENMCYAPDNFVFIQALTAASIESQNISTRVKSAIDFKRTRGDECVGKLPYGLRYAEIRNTAGKIIRKVVEIDPTKQETIRELHKLANNEEEFFLNSEIAKILNDRGLFKYPNKKWTSSMVYNMRYTAPIEEVLEKTRERVSKRAETTESFWTINPMTEQPETSAAGAIRTKYGVSKKFTPY